MNLAAQWSLSRFIFGLLLTFSFRFLLLFRGALFCSLILVLLAFVSHHFPPFFECPRLRVRKPSAAWRYSVTRAPVHILTLQLCFFFVNGRQGKGIWTIPPIDRSAAYLTKGPCPSLPLASRSCGQVFNPVNNYQAFRRQLTCLPWVEVQAITHFRQSLGQPNREIAA